MILVPESQTGFLYETVPANYFRRPPMDSMTYHITMELRAREQDGLWLENRTILSMNTLNTDKPKINWNLHI